MPSFDFPLLVWWGLPLAAVPLVIHLINLLRHRRVPFAAIEFLLASQKKYRTRVLLRQLVLLALRTAAVVGMIAALAQPRWRSTLGALFGGGPALHVVLLDDSGSMRERGSEADAAATAFDRGREAVTGIATAAAVTPQPSEVAVGRFSVLARGAAAAVPPFDLPRQAAAADTASRLAADLARRPASSEAIGPAAALEAVLPGLVAEDERERIVWLVSDFRAADWSPTGPAAAATRRLAEAGVALRFIDCGETGPTGPAGNLTIERLEVVGGVPAAGVLVPLRVTVRNDGPGAAREVAVALREDGASRPGARIAEIPAGGSASASFEVRFAGSGSHIVAAELRPDTLDIDDARTAVVDVVERAAVLVIDGETGGDGRGGDAFYVATALAPGAGATTGVQPRIEPARALASLDLAAFDSVWILDPPRLDEPEVAALEAYVAGGGGAVFFAGPRTQAETVNRVLHRGGEGLFPLPLAGPVDLPGKPASDPVPDIVVEDHPVVAVLAGRRNPLLDAVRIDRVMAAAAPRPGEVEAPGVRRLLSLRTGAALAVERPFGEGTVVAVLSTAAPVWNNWARGNPSWVVVLLELESHLARGRRRGEEWEVGAPVILPLDDAPAGTEVDVVAPPDGRLVRQAARPASGGRGELFLASTEAAGAYLAGWTGLDGAPRQRAFAVNVDPAEGRLERIGRERLAAALPGVAFTFEAASSFDPAGADDAGGSIVLPLLIALAAILLLEQLLAALAGYHPPRRGRPRPSSPVHS